MNPRLDEWVGPVNPELAPVTCQLYQNNSVHLIFTRARRWWLLVALVVLTLDRDLVFAGQPASEVDEFAAFATERKEAQGLPRSGLFHELLADGALHEARDRSQVDFFFADFDADGFGSGFAAAGLDSAGLDSDGLDSAGLASAFESLEEELPPPLSAFALSV